MRKRCEVSFDSLADFHDGRADRSVAETIREHLGANCAHCLETLAWLERSTATMREATSVELPHGLVDRLQGLYTERFRMPVRRSLAARLGFDGRTTPALAGARGVAQEAFKLNYSTDEHDIDIWQEPVGDGNWYVIGQVLPREGDEEFQPQQIVLTPSRGEEMTITPDLPEFHLPSVPAGTYHTAIRLQDSDILIEDFVVGRNG